MQIICIFTTGRSWIACPEYFGKDFSLNWYHYGFRMYDPQLGRFPSLDPKADEFAYVSPYDYAENSPISSIDLWGLQKFVVNTIGAEVAYRGKELNRITNGEVTWKHFNNNTPAKDVYNYIRTLSESDPKGLGFTAIFGHGGNQSIRGSTESTVRSINYKTLDKLEGTNFTENGLIYLGGCNNGSFVTNIEGNAETLANKFSVVSGQDVVANDGGVAPGKPELDDQGMWYQSKFYKEQDFYLFSGMNEKEKLGDKVNILELFNKTKERIERNTEESTKK